MIRARPASLRPRWLYWMPLAVVTVCGALWLFRLGWIAAHVDESALLDHYARLYVAETGEGARLSDCVGRPGQGDGVRLVISCTAPDGGKRVYAIGRFGGLLEQIPASGDASKT
ncbi:hypothetical protein [Pseudosulfitobacter pseudonitzschiae]|uniref:hypothetical protein n=1 Tax=Pseudosulfitobacter pseudonitzschiae TaxID=1402135 RepID=UPI001AF5BE8F|nr:hypothetical protein [Pseudosulfitobacter pseudonitzschiae]MBM1814321.1 hypothetical protein [Pseudosulfitobacter pseudonitzschiae]MBM1831314.1 hypothetical protein [Pseudosulfitobacter pseudonitzschiae]MBM1836181.1 hypothetical protein [Pseudosulfitobacter pseudonitzschiae]MBM1841027.1 hypothetical protein [Pseudosulfitobacter pseudonitzschiae]MBM1845895.1 hypothetical protein [Pseudosulfitobacter pseudonitzschiae]